MSANFRLEVKPWGNIPTVVELTEAEVPLVESICNNSLNMAGLWKASIMTIRTDINHLCSDLFFPTLINAVIKTTTASEQTFEYIALALLWDALTFPIRLITLIPRVFYNLCTHETPHPLIAFLQQKGFPMIESHSVTPLGPNNILYGEGDPIDLMLYQPQPDGPVIGFPATDCYTGRSYRFRLSNHEIPAFDVGFRGPTWGGRLRD